MKTNNMSDATKVLILVATVIVVCVLCAVGFKMVNEGKSSVNASTNNFNNMTSQYSDIDLAIYDGANVQGSEVTNLIRKAIESKSYLSITVKTKAAKSYTDYNYEFKAPDSDAGNTTEASLGEEIKAAADSQLKTDKKSSDYINPAAQFTGKVYKDANGVIICIKFTQI
ncbi:MAG TPA: hypothetical protein DEG06_01850 [Lachnospiraceae bacterium]|jgi:hypothetical protein|nr:hypothetical protein [Lachnospiraceae bacterium]HCM13657.1 hypothetical protein [Lachnospiraceae bacterium]